LTLGGCPGRIQTCIARQLRVGIAGVSRHEFVKGMKPPVEQELTGAE
jgi:hypothetical protein